ncbi:MAG: undecaprenyldiphospho-muramoylpentapeptide beta-N-acetylglucosaminyltransferase [Caulobacteraceae bacterium]
MPKSLAQARPAERTAVIAAGGTGGHLFPAQALAQALGARGWRIVLASDERVAGLASNFPAERRIVLSSATFRRGDPFGAAAAAFSIARGVFEARGAFAGLSPDVVVGFGGYPSIPAILAAASEGRRTLIHEQNAVLGRANRRLAPFASEVACGFPKLLKASAKVRARAVTVGNPVRAEIAALANEGYEPPGEEIRLLVTGGSQGARLLSELVPAAVAKLPEAMRLKLKVVQQTRPESMEAARRIYADATVAAEIAPFFRGIAERLKAAHLVIGRAGASTVSEIAVAGRPSLLVPLKASLDDDQGQNAAIFAEAGAAEAAREDALTRPIMTAALRKLLSSPRRLSKMAAAAKGLGRPDAAERLADLVEKTAR